MWQIAPLGRFVCIAANILRSRFYILVLMPALGNSAAFWMFHVGGDCDSRLPVFGVAHSVQNFAPVENIRTPTRIQSFEFVVDC